MVADDIKGLLCEALDDAPTLGAQLDTPEELLSAFDKAKTALDPVSELVAVLAGDWFDVVVALGSKEHEHFVRASQIPEADRLALVGRVSWPHLLEGAKFDGERRVYLVEPGLWGCFMRARYEGEQDLRIDIKPVSFRESKGAVGHKPECHFSPGFVYENNPSLPCSPAPSG